VDRSIGFGHDTERMAVATRPSPIAWLLAPALLLFVLFFVLPFGVMAMMSFSRQSGEQPQRLPRRGTTSASLRQRSSISMRCRDPAHRRDHDDRALLIGYPLAHWMARMHSRSVMRWC
jgi:putative spermidine/putrescine transport system permease protein